MPRQSGLLCVIWYVSHGFCPSVPLGLATGEMCRVWVRNKAEESRLLSRDQGRSAILTSCTHFMVLLVILFGRPPERLTVWVHARFISLPPCSRPSVNVDLWPKCHLLQILQSSKVGGWKMGGQSSSNLYQVPVVSGFHLLHTYLISGSLLDTENTNTLRLNYCIYQFL